MTGTRHRMRRIAVPLTCGILCLALLSCDHPPSLERSGSPARGIVWRDAPGDSQRILEYFDLSEAERLDRSAAGLEWSALAAGAGGLPRRIHCLQEAVISAPDRIDDWLQLARLAVRVGDLQRALGYLDRVGALVDGLPVDQRRAYRLVEAQDRTWIYRDRVQMVKARNWLQRCLQLDPKDRDTVLLQGLVLAEQGDLRAANNIALGIERENRMRRDWRNKFEWRWVRGMSELSGGYTDAAFTWMVSARPDPEYAPRFYRDFGDIAARTGRRDEAALYYAMGFQATGLAGLGGIRHHRPAPGEDAGPGRYPYWTHGDFHLVAGSTSAFATAALDSFHASVPGERRNRWADTAAGMLSICIRKQLDTEACRVMRGKLYAEIGAYDLAETDLTRVMNDHPEGRDLDPEVLLWLGYLNIQKQENGAALPLLEQVTVLDPGNARAWSYLGCALMALGRELDGAQALDRAIGLSPDLPEAWFNRGLFHFRDHRWAEAARDLERALELAPGNMEIMAMLQQSKMRIRRQSGETTVPPDGGG